MWLDEEPTLLRVPPPPNRAAMVIGDAFGQGHLYVGTVVFTGAGTPRGDTRDLPGDRFTELAVLLNRVGVSIADDGEPTSGA
jgi:hypothetical protein